MGKFILLEIKRIHNHFTKYYEFMIINNIKLLIDNFFL